LHQQATIDAEGSMLPSAWLSLTCTQHNMNKRSSVIVRVHEPRYTHVEQFPHEQAGRVPIPNFKHQTAVMAMCALLTEVQPVTAFAAHGLL
jgi:hypothetical protein